jgi:hypothetical protein
VSCSGAKPSTSQMIRSLRSRGGWSSPRSPLGVFAALGALHVWVLAGFAGAEGLDQDMPAEGTWTYGNASSWLVIAIPALLPLLGAVALFLVDRFQANRRVWRAKWSLRSRIGVWWNLPTALDAAWIIWLLAVPGMLALAHLVHNLWWNRTDPNGNCAQVQAALLATGRISQYGGSSSVQSLRASYRPGERTSLGSKALFILWRTMAD